MCSLFIKTPNEHHQLNFHQTLFSSTYIYSSQAPHNPQFEAIKKQNMAHNIMPWLLLAQLLLLVVGIGAKVPAVIVFGDSSVDAGNNNQISTVLKSNFQPYGRDFYGGQATGRFSNGRIPPDFISEAFGLKPAVPAYLDPMYNIKDFATGVCFASAGTGYDNATSDVLSVIPLWKELEYYKVYQMQLRGYLGVAAANNVLSQALYLTSIGTNDFLENYYTTQKRSSQFSVRQYEDFLIGIAGNFITEIYSLGARKISVGGLPPMGCLPLERSTNFMGGNACVDEYNNVAKIFNWKLQKMVVKLNQQLPGIRVVLSNPYDIFLQITQNPSAYGKPWQLRHKNMAHNIMPWLLLVQLLLLVVEIGAKVPAIIIFGDSSVDAGNNNQISTIAKSNFEPYGRDFAGGRPTGRFSNGRIPSDFISEAFGLKPTVPAYLDPMYTIRDFATGVCFASAGTGYDNATSDVLSVIPLWKELEYYKEYRTRLRGYLGAAAANNVLSEALYLMSMGTNDFLENYYTRQERSSQFSIRQYENFLVRIAGNFITELYHLGARKISLGGLPPMGCLPLERATNFMGGNECEKEYNNVARIFNWKLQRLIVNLNQGLPGIRVVLSSPYDTLLQIIQNPSSYGFENAEVACCGTGMFEMGYICGRSNPLTCTDANKYVFWDAFHPSEKANQIMADHVVKNCLAQFL
ncbi:hypothetical protein HHK36_002172 [Tetracentron sinense]|uniref:GDSL esterase/lipase n=1 Tax=Tetracentron sinense TaxID=13715 RepID=A0A834ZZD5_TETSI|nr:hypothetical protein HHK36_002172 [Tetracentron sinense]